MGQVCKREAYHEPPTRSLTGHSVPLPTQCDRASHVESDAFFRGLWALKIGDSPRDAPTFGYIHPWVAERLPWPTTGVAIDKRSKAVRLLVPATARDAQMIAWRLDIMLTQTLREGAIPRELFQGKRHEAYPVLGAPFPLTIDRGASQMLGLTQRAAFLVCYVRDPRARHGVRLWVPRRGWDRREQPGLLDATAAGGMAAGEHPRLCIAREASEEVGLDEATVYREARSVGAYSWYTIRRTGGAFAGVKPTAANKRLAERVGVVYPSMSYIYEMEMPAHWKPDISSGEVAEVYCWTVDEVKAAMARGEFKNTTAMIMMDFFIRWGLMTHENEPDYEEIIQRLHRRLPFPVR